MAAHLPDSDDVEKGALIGGNGGKDRFFFELFETGKSSEYFFFELERVGMERSALEVVFGEEMVWGAMLIVSTYL